MGGKEKEKALEGYFRELVYKEEELRVLKRKISQLYRGEISPQDFKKVYFGYLNEIYLALNRYIPFALERLACPQDERDCSWTMILEVLSSSRDKGSLSNSEKNDSSTILPRLETFLNKLKLLNKSLKKKGISVEL